MSDSRPQYRRNVAAVIMDADGYVLVGRKKEGGRFIHFPQGGVGKKETFEQALWREIAEEVGLQREQLQIVARLAGLSYDYRRKNRKREKWAGQEQTYYLIRCTGARPAFGPRVSTEFGVLEWVPFLALSPEQFVSFKRPVVTEVLQSFFPSDMKDLSSHLDTLDTQNRYRYDAVCELSMFSPSDRALFVGGKQEALAQMDDLQVRITAAQKALDNKRVLVLLYDANTRTAKRRTNCLRRVGSVFDPILTCVQKPADIAALTDGGRCVLPALVPTVPAAGETLFLSESVYSIAGQLTQEQLESVADFEQLLVDDGVMVLKFFLNITAEQWEDCGESSVTARDHAERVLRATSNPIPWYIVPAEKKWYRDYVIAAIVAQTLENSISDSKTLSLGEN